MLQTAQFQLCTKLSVLEPQQDALSSCSHKALAARGWEGPCSLPWHGRRFQNHLGIEESQAQRGIKARIPNKASRKIWWRAG